MKDIPEGMSSAVADKVGAALEAKLRAETEKAIAERDEALERVTRSKILTKTEQMQFEQNEQKFREWKASDLFAHVYYFGDMVCEASVEKCMTILDLWDRTEPGCEITLVFNSPGGSVIDGLALYDHIQMIRRHGHKVTTLAEGMAASMAGILLQSGEVRAIGNEAWVLIHQVQAAMMGTMGQIEDRMKMLNRIQERVLDIFAAKADEARIRGTAAEALTKEQFKERWERTDWWLSSEDCLRYGVVDEVR